MRSYEPFRTRDPLGWAVVCCDPAGQDVVCRVVALFPDFREGEVAAERRAHWLALTMNYGVVR